VNNSTFDYYKTIASMKANKFEELISSISGSTIIKGMPELAYVFNKKGQMLMWNKNIETVLGYSKDELLYKNIMSSPKTSKYYIQLLFTQAIKGEVAEYKQYT